MRTLHVWPELARASGPDIKCEAVLEYPDGGRKPLWFRSPLGQSPQPGSNSDPFVVAAIFSAMHHADVMKVHGAVSPSLLANLHEFQAAWAAWCPGLYRVVELQADEEKEEPAASNPKALMSFSGGLDSSFTAWRHTGGRAGQRLRQDLGAALMVHGFDIPLADTEAFAHAASNSRAMLDSIGLATLTVATNFRELRENWEHVHGAGLAAALHLFKRSFAAAVIASSHTYDTLRMGWGSNPITDGLLASANFPFVHDGCGFWRREKARAVAQWPVGTQRLRVCWEGPQKDRNCGACLRCVGTAICFAVEGAPVPPSIPVSDLARSIRALSGTHISPVAVQRLAELLAVAASNRIEAPWVEALQRLVVRKRRSGAVIGLLRKAPFAGRLRELKRQWARQ